MDKMNHKILLIDDNPVFSEAFVLYMHNKGFSVDSCSTPEAGLANVTQNDYIAVFADYQLPGMNGLDLIQNIKSIKPALECVMITGHASLETAVKAGRIGVYDYLTKPFQPEQALELVNRIVNAQISWSQDGYFSGELDGKPFVIVGNSPAMQAIINLIKKIAPTESTILILGESGTGKELIARAIHANSLRADKPFFAMDCGSLVETLFESELFGHAKGSFTGAHTTKHGAFELAHEGTFFFDEIGNISLNMQAKILRAIQEKEIRRVGDTKLISVDVRVISATNRDLKQAVDEGTFREDLYYRLSVIPIQLPPLRERREDIPILVSHFIQKYNHRRRGRDIESISDSALAAILNYTWPGNIRELENVIERAMVIEESSIIHLSSLPGHILSKTGAVQGEEGDIETLAQIEKRHIEYVMKQVEGNISKAARVLQIDRKTLYDKIRKYDI